MFWVAYSGVLGNSRDVISADLYCVHRGLLTDPYRTTTPKKEGPWVEKSTGDVSVCFLFIFSLPGASLGFSGGPRNVW
jgi:hypothetical protein